MKTHKSNFKKLRLEKINIVKLDKLEGIKGGITPTTTVPNTENIKCYTDINKTIPIGT